MNEFIKTENERIKTQGYVDQCIVKHFTYTMLPLSLDLKLTPNFITTLSLICGIISSIMIYQDDYYAGSIFFLFRYLLDCLDGPLARLSKTTSQLGDIYDHLVDYTTFILFYIICFVKKFSLFFFIILHFLLITSIIHYAILARDKKKGIIYNITKFLPLNKNLTKWTINLETGTMTLFTTIAILLHDK